VWRKLERNVKECGKEVECKGEVLMKKRRNAGKCEGNWVLCKVEESEKNAGKNCEGKSRV